MEVFYTNTVNLVIEELVLISLGATKGRYF